MAGTSYIKLPKNYWSSINIKNSQDKYCATCCILADFVPAETNVFRTGRLRHYFNLFCSNVHCRDFDGGRRFNDDIPKFKQVNFYQYMSLKYMEKDCIFIVFFPSEKYKNEIFPDDRIPDLLLYKNHYCRIKMITYFLRTGTRKKLQILFTTFTIFFKYTDLWRTCREIQVIEGNFQFKKSIHFGGFDQKIPL